MTELKRWQDIEPKDAVDLDLTVRLDITAPLNEMGERCPWPWEPQQLIGVPLGQYRCSYCMAMCVAGITHPSYEPGWDEPRVFPESVVPGTSPAVSETATQPQDKD